MAAACALALGFVIAPLHDDGPAPVRAPGPVVQGQYADTDDGAADCTDPEASLDPALGSTDGAAVRRIIANGRLVVGVDQNSYLWGFRDPATGQLAGFDIDLVKAIAQDILGDSSKVQYLTVPTANRIEMIQTHKVDMVIRTMTINCDRIKQVAFSTAYFTAGQQLLVPDGSPITGYNDSLRGETVCTASGSTGLAKLTGTPDDGGGLSDAQRFGVKVITVDNQLDCLVRVQLGLADAVFTDNALAAGQAAQDPAMHLVGQPVTTEPYGVAMNLDDQDLVRRVNRILDSYRTDGAWMASYDHWLSADMPGISGPPAPKYKD